MDSNGDGDDLKSDEDCLTLAPEEAADAGTKGNHLLPLLPLLELLPAPSPS